MLVILHLEVDHGQKLYNQHGHYYCLTNPSLCGAPYILGNSNTKKSFFLKMLFCFWLDLILHVRAFVFNEYS